MVFQVSNEACLNFCLPYWYKKEDECYGVVNKYIARMKKFEDYSDKKENSTDGEDKTADICYITDQT